MLSLSVAQSLKTKCQWGDQPWLQRCTEQWCELDMEYSQCSHVVRTKDSAFCNQTHNSIVRSGETYRASDWVCHLWHNCVLKKFGRRWRSPCSENKTISQSMEKMTAWWSTWGMKWDPLNIACWKHKWGFLNRGVTWDTPMARRAGSGEDWLQKWRMSLFKKTEAVPSLVCHPFVPLQIKKTEGGILLRKEREFDPLITSF